MVPRSDRQCLASLTCRLAKIRICAQWLMLGAVNFSPDGKWLPQIETATDSSTQTVTHRIALLDANANSEKAAKYVVARPDIFNFVAVTPDGKSLAYVVTENGVGNIWAQPLDGSKGHALTNFPSDQISAFQFSPDGNSLAVARVHIVSDVVLLRDSSTASR
jgi:WD40 repeat protein